MDPSDLLMALSSLEEVVLVLTPDGVVQWVSQPGRFEVSIPLVQQLSPEHRRRFSELSTQVCASGQRSSMNVGPTDRIVLLPWSTSDGARGLLARLERRGRTEQQLDLALSATQMGLWRWHIATGEVFWDDRMHEITGEPTPLDLPQWLELLTHPDDRIDAAKPGDTVGPFEPSVSRIVRRSDGATRWLMTIGNIVRTSDGTAIEHIGGTLDVTSQYRMAEELEEARRLEALAHLTAHVAHNFNNMLMIVGPSLQMLAEDASPGLKTTAAGAIEATDRAAHIVSQLMVFSGLQHRQKRTKQQAARLCERAVRLAQASAYAVIIEQHIACTGTLMCSATAVEEVLVNLLRNGCDAVDRGGRVGLTTTDLVLNDETWMQVVVWDDGPGIPPELVDRVFEPFFTTKGAVGTGLGLASSRAIVVDHGGQLVYRPREGGGAEFLMLLPYTKNASKTGPAPVRPSVTAPGQIHVLLIEDQAAICRMMCRGLPKVGPFEVHTLSSETEVANALDNLPPPHVVLLDRDLNGFDGRRLVGVLRERLPQAHILFFTGHPLSPEECTIVDGVVPKPVSLPDLAARLIEAYTDSG